MSYIVPHYINGQTLTANSNTTHIIHNPTTGQPIGKVYLANQAQCEQAIKSAKNAWPAWADTTPTKRAQILFNFRTLLAKHQLELATIINSENGKTLEDAKGSIMRGLELVECHCGLVTQLQGTFSANVSTDMDCYTFRQPLGICAGVSPFNFPVMVPLWMMIPAIACGNAFILKPSEQDPSASLFLFELLHDAGLPPGVANCLQGNHDTVDHLLSHPDIMAFTAVASTPVAKSIYLTAIQNGKRAHTFGGAKNHAVVMPDADFSSAAKAISGAAFGSAGERCMAISVVVTVGSDTKHKLLNELIPLIHQIRIDAGDKPEVDLGPLISHAHRQRVIQAVTQGINEGAELLIDGRDYQHKDYPEGFFMGPCLFDSVTESMSIYQNELFGPVLVIMSVDDLDQAIALVNRNQYGNGTAIFTQSGYQAHYYSRHVQVGMVGVNVPIPVPIASHPFGGWKHSAFGDHSMHGQDSIHFYSKTKTITTKWLLQQTQQNSFVMPENG